MSKLATGTIDTQLFEASTSTQVVKNKAESTEIPVDVEAYLKSADSSGVEVSPVGGESPPAKSGGGAHQGVGMYCVLQQAPLAAHWSPLH